MQHTITSDFLQKRALRHQQHLGSGDPLLYYGEKIHHGFKQCKYHSQEFVAPSLPAEKRYIRYNFSDVLSFTMPNMYKINIPVPHDEIAQMFRVINRDTAIRKRDYAMFLIAVVTGMRSIDIVGPQFSDIDWVNGEIKITQKKTDVPLALPLTQDIGETLTDYILHGHPKSNFPNIFLTSRPPIRPLGQGCVYNAFSHAKEISGQNKRPFYDLRRAAGTSMVAAGIPVTTLAQEDIGRDFSAPAWTGSP